MYTGHGDSRSTPERSWLVLVVHGSLPSPDYCQAQPTPSMARDTTSQWSAPISSYLLPRGDTLLYCLALFFIVSLLSQHLSRCSALSPHFEGFEADDDEEETPTGPSEITDLPIPPPVVTQSHFEETDRGPPEQSPPSVPPSPKPSPAAAFEYWDEDEFEGLPPPASDPLQPEPPSPTDASSQPSDPVPPSKPPPPRSYTVEIVSISFLIAFVLNYFTGKRENENIALAWAAKFATKDSIFEKNFSLLGTGDGNDAPLLLKEGQDVFKFYASGRRFCQGLLATMELKCRHDLIARIYNLIVPSRDTITFEVYMNDENMDQVLFAMARKKAAKTMQKEVKDLQRYASLMSTPTGRKWVAEDLAVVTESREAAGDLVTDAVLEQVTSSYANLILCIFMALSCSIALFSLSSRFMSSLDFI
ncbi:hypothetical protein ACLOJK_034678 [Asimina triloba]